MDLKDEINRRGARAKQFIYKMTEEYIHPEDPLRLASEWLFSAGKGFRPAMLQLACGALGGEEDRSLPLAAAIEIVHVSSLIHDDFMDHDKSRRGMEAVWVKWDPTIAILAGDVLVGLAFTICGEIDNLNDHLKYHLTRELASIYTKLCHGQMLDIGFETMDLDGISVDQIKEMQLLKTGVLFEYACVAGARLALNRLEDPLIDVIREYAQLAGTAFQIQDDIIGLIGDEQEVGKPIGSDIRQGKRTLIAVHAYSNTNEAQRERLMLGLGNKDATPSDIESTLNVMQEIGSIDYAKKLAFDMASRAETLLDQLPENENTEILKQFARYMVEREY